MESFAFRVDLIASISVMVINVTRVNLRALIVTQDFGFLRLVLVQMMSLLLAVHLIKFFPLVGSWTLSWFHPIVSCQDPRIAQLGFLFAHSGALGASCFE